MQSDPPNAADDQRQHLGELLQAEASKLGVPPRVRAWVKKLLAAEQPEPIPPAPTRKSRLPKG